MYSKGVRPFEGCEPAHIIVGIDEVVKVSVELLMALVIRAFDGGVLNRPVHAFNLAIRSGMLDLGEAVLDPVLHRMSNIWVQLAFHRSDRGDVDMKVADGVWLEPLLRLRISRHFR